MASTGFRIPKKRKGEDDALLNSLDKLAQTDHQAFRKVLYDAQVAYINKELSSGRMRVHEYIAMRLDNGWYEAAHVDPPPEAGLFYDPDSRVYWSCRSGLRYVVNSGKWIKSGASSN